MLHLNYLYFVSVESLSIFVGFAEFEFMKFLIIKFNLTQVCNFILENRVSEA